LEDIHSIPEELGDAMTEYGRKAQQDKENIIWSMMKQHHIKENEFLTMSTQDLIDYLITPPKDAEYNELKAAGEICARRYRDCLASMSKF